MIKNIAIIGSSGAIGSACVDTYAAIYPDAMINSFSRHDETPRHDNQSHHIISYEDEKSLEDAAKKAAINHPFDIVIVATGLLHEGDIIAPEKALKDLSADKFHALFQANCIFPSLCAKYFLPLMNTQDKAVFAALSARVGSISDNHMGGWYAYRASKAALNMVIKNAAIEMGRRHKNMIIVGLHPGTVDSDLSKPFQSHVPAEKLFSPAQAASYLCGVIKNLRPSDSGKIFAWDGQEIHP